MTRRAKLASAAAAVVVAAGAVVVAGGRSGTSPSGLPPASVPGATNPAVTQANIASTICVSGWTATVRPPASYTDALKAKQLGSGQRPSEVEEDHRIPLGSGGAPRDPRNLWPEPWTGPRGAHAKDRIEVRVQRDICAGRLTLAQGRAVFEGDWWTATVP